MSKIYRIALINERLNTRLFLNITAETALDAIAEAKAWNPGYETLEACTLIGVADAKAVTF